MIKKRFYKPIEIFKNHNGILRVSEAVKLGIPEYLIYDMSKAGILFKEERGLYRLIDFEFPGNPDLVKVSLLSPKAVVCLISALYFHRLTTQIPYEVYIALPQNIRAPRIEYPPIEVVWLSEKPYNTGIEEFIIDGVNVKIYNREKTVTDCFKFRNKIGNDITIEALKDYIRQPQPDFNKLLEYARVNRVENLIKPYLETLI